MVIAIAHVGWFSPAQANMLDPVQLAKVIRQWEFKNTVHVTYFKHLGKRTMDHKVQLHPEPLSYFLVSWYAHLCTFTFRPLFHAKSVMISRWPLVVL